MLLVSGGHTMLVSMEGHGRYRLLGSTIDDAAGEAFDKVARYLGLGYPGGPAIDRLAMEGDPTAIRFPRAMLDEGFDFSFSGLKTAVVNHVRKHPDVATADVARQLPGGGRRRARRRRRAGPPPRSAPRPCASAAAWPPTRSCASGSSTPATRTGCTAFLPSRAMCTDNAAMVAAAGVVAPRAATARPPSTPAPTPTSACPS